VTSLNNGTVGRGNDIRQLLQVLGPTAVQLRQIGDLLAVRRTKLAAIVHNLGVLAHATSVKDAQLQTVVRAGDQTVSALASQDVALQDSVERLPGTLQTTRTTLQDVTGFANALGPTATALLPFAHGLPTTLQQAHSLSQAAIGPLQQIPPFVDAVQPLAAQLEPLAADLKVEVPALIDSFKVLTYVTNEIGFNPGGKNPGFLYWLAWFAHNADSFISTSDANGPVWRLGLIVSCASLKSFAILGPLLETVLGTSFGC
jgi:phospholipid/cholesterol/gamma-HCH transport system substrate-binding protein